MRVCHVLGIPVTNQQVYILSGHYLLDDDMKPSTGFAVTFNPDLAGVIVSFKRRHFGARFC